MNSTNILKYICALSIMIVLVGCMDESNGKGSSGCHGEIGCEEMTDNRDGQKYKIVKIGKQTWMAENLNYETRNSSCYKDKAKNCTKYGRLYQWSAANSVCPSGWHLPTVAEWYKLITSAGGETSAGKVLKSTLVWKGNAHWKDGGAGTDSFGFSALPAGYRSHRGEYYYENEQTFFWTATEMNKEWAAYWIELSLYNDRATMRDDPHYGVDKNYWFSVRCLKDKK